MAATEPTPTAQVKSKSSSAPGDATGRAIRPALNPEAAGDIQIQTVSDYNTALELDRESLDPNYTYRWVYRHPTKVGRAKARGYRLVDSTSEDIKNAVGDSPDAAEDGTYVVGDLVLMRTLKSIRRGRRKELNSKRDRRLKGPTREFKKTAKQKGRRYQREVEVITDKE